MDRTKYQEVCKESCVKAVEVLKNGGSALDACEAAIICLEDCSDTNAGFGSNLTWDGRVECEASIMDGITLNYGACSNIAQVKNPIRVARTLCDKQAKLLKFGRIPPMVLTGEGATKFARDSNIETVEEESLISKKAHKTFTHYKNHVTSYETLNNMKLTSLDTVGAVVVDGDGNIAAGCSSGGIILKVPGRMGQAASYGAGCWAISTPMRSVATCTTGNGEYLTKTFLSKEIANGLLVCECPVTALYKTFEDKFLESPYLSGIDEKYGGALSIMYDPKAGHGDILWSHTTKTMCLGYMTTLQRKPKFVTSSLPSYCTAGKKVVVSGYNCRLSV